MRKIESQMIAAIHESRDWKSDNTKVVFKDNESHVYLYDNHIATIDDDSLTIFDGGFRSNTTKSRLNAICDAFCIEGEGIFQKNYKWFIRRVAGQVGPNKLFIDEEFTNGFVFS